MSTSPNDPLTIGQFCKTSNADCVAQVFMNTDYTRMAQVFMNTKMKQINDTYSFEIISLQNHIYIYIFLFIHLWKSVTPRSANILHPREYRDT